ncbi:MAG: hypothetical protein C0417_08655 [Chlorobiaceae bacterium]|nr:hypothetical protein [Chlorobiaceae bacterium]
MDNISIIFIAFGLSMDAVAVAVSMGLSINSLRIKHGILIGLFFGVFQAVMPVIGWITGKSLQNIIVGVDHWVAFGLLTLIGAKMIYESVKPNPDGDNIKSLTVRVLLILSIATSIDAFAIGISFAILQISIITPILIIGGITFLLSFLGVGLGKHVGYLFSKKIEIVGGVILILIGVKILFEHLFMI